MRRWEREGMRRVGEGRDEEGGRGIVGRGKELGQCY